MQGRSIFLELFFATFRTESVFFDNKGFSFRSLLQLSVVDSLFLHCVVYNLFGDEILLSWMELDRNKITRL